MKLHLNIFLTSIIKLTFITNSVYRFIQPQFTVIIDNRKFLFITFHKIMNKTLKLPDLGQVNLPDLVQEKLPEVVEGLSVDDVDGGARN